jgi:hypothetical protein
MDGGPQPVGYRGRIKRITLKAHQRLKEVNVHAAFVNQAPLDTSKEMYVFSERPKFGDILALTHERAMATPGAKVTLHIELFNPRGDGDHGSIREVFASEGLKIQWDISSTAGWTPLGWSQVVSPEEASAAVFRDGTKALTQSGAVVFIVPPDVDQQEVNGVKAVWVRARILAGDYGTEVIVQPRDLKAPEKGYVWTAATLGPPVVSTIRISMEHSTTELSPESLMTCNDFAYQDVMSSIGDAGNGFIPFFPMDGELPELRLGVRRQNWTGSEAGYPLSFYFHGHTDVPDSGEEGIVQLKSDLDWEYWNGSGWTRLSVVDETAALRKPGSVQICIPSDWRPAPYYDGSMYWIRARVQDRRRSLHVQCRGIMLHTVMAQHATTLYSEVLGSSHGTANQSFRTLRVPVLPGQVLEISERSPQSAESRVWVTWNVVEHFLHSGPHDRHYTIDRQTGQILFGDGHRGAIPPPGTDNIVFKEYRVGGGSGGNILPETLTQLRTTIPFVQQVSNPLQANGGADAEPLEVFVPRALRVVRHRHRAVTSEDYEDLALAASPLVARASCVPSFDLKRDPFAKEKRSGVVSVIVLPRSDSEAPTPDESLLDVVRRYLKDHAPTGITICVVGPRYVPLHVEVDVVLQPGTIPAVVERSVKHAIDKFLHPVSGGPDGQGWDAGSYPAQGALHSCLVKVPGVHHVRRVHLGDQDECQTALKSDYSHVCSGTHRVHCELLSSE